MLKRKKTASEEAPIIKFLDSKRTSSMAPTSESQSLLLSPAKKGKKKKKLAGSKTSATTGRAKVLASGFTNYMKDE